MSAPAQAAGAVPAVVDCAWRRGRGGVAVIALVTLGLTLGALGHVAVHAKRLEVGLELGKEERIHKELAEQRRHLQIEIGMLKDPDRITRIARETLGMAPPTPADIRAVRGSGSALAQRARP